MTVSPAAFMSYAWINDEHDYNQLSEFRQRLSGELQVQSGREFPIFQDRNDVLWGENWRQRIEETLNAATVLLVIMTPSFFASNECCNEVRIFLEREGKLGRTGLIFPVYYIDADQVDFPRRHDSGSVARILADRQCHDWRELRFEPQYSPVVRRAMAALAKQLLARLSREVTGAPDGNRPGVPSAVNSYAPEPVVSPHRNTVRSEPPAHVVDKYYRGGFTTVSAAIEAANPGDRILLRPGLYEEGIVIDKTLEIIGDGPLSDIEIRSRNADAVLFRASSGRISNLTVRQDGGKGSWFGVDISQGRLDMEGCDISSKSLACVAVRDHADPRLRRNIIHDGAEVGVFFHRGAAGTLEDNDISANTYSGVIIKSESNPTLRRNRIYANQTNGVRVEGGGAGTLEDNDITGNGSAGISIIQDGRLIIRGNRINHNSLAGVVVVDFGRGVIEDNDLTDNQGGPVYIAEDCQVNVALGLNTL